MVKIHSARRSLAGWFLVVAAGLLAAGCGGGGGGSSSGQFQGGLPIISPDGATFYAGVPSTLSVTGGRRPYTITFSEPSLVGLPNPVVLDGTGAGALTLSFVPANPGVVDTGLPPGSLPVRTVNVVLRDAQGQTASSSFKVGQNFLLGYGVSLVSNCRTGSAGSPPAACAGGETVVRLVPVTNGDLYGGRPVRFEVVRGPFGFVQLPEGTVVGNDYTTTTDHTGVATAVLRVDKGAPGQFAILRVIDVATGVFVNEVFPVAAASATTLTVLPSTFTFTGANDTVCGTGTGQFMVMDGVSPYSAISSDPNVSVSPASTGGANPAVFTISANNPSACVDAFVVVTDANGGRVSVEVKTQKGTTSIPKPPAIKVNPSSLTLVCGTSGSVSVVGGNGGYILNSTHPRVTAVASANTITITRLSGDAPTASYPTTATISVTDGTSTDSIAVTVPANCP